MAAITAVLTVPARDVRPGDAVTEGTVVSHVTVADENVRNLFTGKVCRVLIVTVGLVPARFVIIEDIPDFGHVHSLDFAAITQRRYRFDEYVQVGRPAPMRPCVCGFTGTEATEARP